MREDVCFWPGGVDTNPTRFSFLLSISSQLCFNI